MAIRLALLAHHYRRDWQWDACRPRERDARLTAGAARRSGRRTAGEAVGGGGPVGAGRDLDAPPR
jgi:hypothetical protein